MIPGTRMSPTVFMEAPEIRAAYVDWDSPAVMEDIYGKPKCMCSFLDFICHLLITDYSVIHAVAEETASALHTSTREKASTHHMAIYIPLLVQSLST